MSADHQAPRRSTAVRARTLVRIALMLAACSTPLGAATWESMASPGDGFLAGSGTTLHFASGNGTVVYRRSTNEGTTWSGNVVLGSGSLYLEDPLIADGSNVYVAYVRDVRSVSDWLGPRPLGNIYLRVSRDNGLTWGPERQITASQSMLRLSFAANGQQVYATWMDYRFGVWDVYFRRSLDGGTTWLPEVRLVAGTNETGAGRPQIACAGSTVHIAWMDGRDGKPPVLIENLTIPMPQSTEIYYKSSPDEGATWGADVRLTSHPTDYSGRPDIAGTPEGTILVSYDHALNGGKLEEFVVRSTNSGAAWQAMQQMSFAANDSTHSYLITSNALVHLAWSDERASRIGVYYRQSSDRGGNWSLEEFVGSAVGKTAPFIAATSNYVHATWAGHYRRRALSTQPGPPQWK